MKSFLELRNNDVQLVSESKTFGPYATDYRIDHRGTTIGYGVKSGPDWIVLDSRGKLLGSYRVLREGCWKIVNSN